MRSRQGEKATRMGLPGFLSFPPRLCLGHWNAILFVFEILTFQHLCRVRPRVCVENLSSFLCYISSFRLCVSCGFFLQGES